MVMENIIGKIKAILRVISQMDLDKAKAFGKKALDIVINTKVSIKMTKSGDMEFSHGQMVISLRETTKLTSETDMDKCIGKMVIIIRGNGKRASNMEKVRFHFNSG